MGDSEDYKQIDSLITTEEYKKPFHSPPSKDEVTEEYKRWAKIGSSIESKAFFVSVPLLTFLTCLSIILLMLLYVPFQQ